VTGVENFGIIGFVVFESLKKFFSAACIATAACAITLLPAFSSTKQYKCSYTSWRTRYLALCDVTTVDGNLKNIVSILDMKKDLLYVVGGSGSNGGQVFGWVNSRDMPGCIEHLARKEAMCPFPE